MSLYTMRTQLERYAHKTDEQCKKSSQKVIEGIKQQEI